MHPIDAGAADGIIITIVLFTILAAGEARHRIQARLERRADDRQAWAALAGTLDDVWADVEAVR